MMITGLQPQARQCGLERQGVRVDTLAMTAGLRRQANAIGERIDDSVGSGLGAGGVLAGDDLARS